MPFATHGALRAWLGDDSHQVLSQSLNGSPGQCNAGVATPLWPHRTPQMGLDWPAAPGSTGRRSSATSFSSLRGSESDFLNAVAQPSRLRSHIDFLDTGSVET